MTSWEMSGLKVFLEHLLIYIDKQFCQTSTTVTSKSRRKWMPWLEDLRYIHSMDRRVCSIYHLRLLLRLILWLRDKGMGDDYSRIRSALMDIGKWPAAPESQYSKGFIILRQI
jgi:hypothetical protein